MGKSIKPEASHLPFARIIEFLTTLIETFRERIRLRKSIAIICCIIGTGFITFALFYRESKDPSTAALIAVGGLFYGTIMFGILQSVWDKGDKIALATKIRNELQEISEAEVYTGNKKFENRFYDLLKTLL